MRKYKILLAITSFIAGAAFVIDRLSRVGQANDKDAKYWCPGCTEEKLLILSFADPTSDNQRRICMSCYQRIVSKK